MKISSSILAISMTLMVGCSSSYHKDLDSALDDSKKLAALSGLITNEIQQTWHTAIFDHEYSRNGKTEYVSDFNEAIQTLLDEPEIKSVNKSIDSLNLTLKTKMGKIVDPPSKYKESYEDMVQVYSSVSELSNLAKSPTGSLQSFKQNVDGLAGVIISKIKAIEIRNPQNN